MIKWYPDLYLDEMAKKKEAKWKNKIEKGKPMLEVYCICIALNPDNLFDIINVNELMFRYYKQKNLAIIGLAYGRTSALKLVEKIALDIYQKTDNFEPKVFFYDYLHEIEG